MCLNHQSRRGVQCLPCPPPFRPFMMESQNEWLSKTLHDVPRNVVVRMAQPSPDSRELAAISLRQPPLSRWTNAILREKQFTTISAAAELIANYYDRREMQHGLLHGTFQCRTIERWLPELGKNREESGRRATCPASRAGADGKQSPPLRSPRRRQKWSAE